MSTTVQLKYHYPRIDDIEDLEKYRPGGLHPVSIGNTLAGGRYKILHKLGFGGSSTIWLARDQRSEERSEKLVTLKILSAEQSCKPISEITIHKQLSGSPLTIGRPGLENLQMVKDQFLEEGPNGSHLCLVFQLAGPSVFSISQCPGRVSGSKRLRGDLARKTARHVATAVELLHTVNVVHGDLTSSNIVFQMSDKIFKWSDDDVYRILGSPNVEDVHTCDGSPPEPYAPLQVVAPIDVSGLLASSLLREDVLLIDFGQSFLSNHMPAYYMPATPLHYLSPEVYFDSKISFASDVWALACTIFEMRAGFPLFDPFLNSDALILKQVVETLGRLPEPWWNSWEPRHKWFDNETGEPKPEEVQRREGGLLPAIKSSIYHKLHEIGEGDDPLSEADEGPMIERIGTRLELAEVELLMDLLSKMLKYHPEDRITMTEVVQHPWFDYHS